MTAFLGKIIIGIPLWLTGLSGKILLGSTKFLAELVGILAFKARWYITAIFWILVLCALVKAEPWVRNNISPVYGAYMSMIALLLGLMLLAFGTRKLRRHWRRAKLEIKVLNTMADAKKHIISIRDERSGGNGLVAKFLARVRPNGRTTGTQEVVTIVEGDIETSMEAMLASVAASAQEQVDAMVAGRPIVRERQPWSLGLKGKSSRGYGHNRNVEASDVELHARELERQAEELRKNSRRKSND